jgi:Family of unknown function (DUF6335)
MRRKRDTDTDEAARRYEPDAPGSEAMIKDDLAEIGRRLVEREFDKYHSVGPELTVGDVDARWQEAEDSGAETPGGHVTTPDQDNVDEIGRAVGMEFQDNQELCAPEEVLSRRDRRRWEMDKRSADGESL